MKITIVSLRDCAIYLEAHTLRMCRLVSSIFKIDKTGAILPVQIADEEFRSRLKQLDILGKNGFPETIRYELNNIPVNSKFIVIVGRDYQTDQIILYRLKGVVYEFNGKENFIQPYAERMEQFSSNYSVCIFNGQGRMQYIGEADKSKRVCRFCHRSAPLTSFTHKSHAISESLGYKSLVCHEECDECNEYFSRTIEPDVVNMHSFLLSLCGISGKKGIRKTCGENFKFWLDRSSRQYNSQGTFMMQLKDLHIENGDIRTGFQNLPPLDTSSLKYIPQNVYKCFCKYAVSCLPQNQIGFFQKTIDWINAPANYRRLPMVASCSVDYTTPLFSLCIRKEQDYRYPDCWASLNIANVRYMFIVPFSSQDRYSFTTKARYQFFLDILRSWFPVLDMQPMQLSSSKPAHTVVDMKFTMDDRCKLGRDYFIIDKGNGEKEIGGQ